MGCVYEAVDVLMPLWVRFWEGYSCLHALGEAG